MKRLFLLMVSKFKSIFQKNIAFSSRIEYSVVSRKAKVWRFCKMYHSSLGDYSYVGPHSCLTYAEVGKFCSVAGDVVLGMGTHTLANLSTSPIFTEVRNGTRQRWVDTNTVDPFRKVKVGNDVWIGLRALVMGGVTIGDGAVIGAGAIVTKDVPPYAVVAGVPARVIRYRFTPEQIEKLHSIAWWNLPESFLRNNLSMFQSNDSEAFIAELSRICMRLTESEIG